MGDLIDRQAAIDAVCGWCHVNCTPCEFFPCGEIKAIQALPPAQPNLQPTCNNLATDAISRQAAIDAIKALWNDAPSAQHVSAMFDCEDAIRALPSAQPEKDTTSDYISRREAIQTALEFIVEYLGGACDEDFQKKLIERINALSSAGPKIIYCRDCKYKMLDTSGDEWICSHPSNNAWRITADHYCGYAEGREE